MNYEFFKKNIPGCGNVIILDSVDSTNNVARNLYFDNAPDKSIVIAKRQTSGRGRQGKSFFSPEGGLYMSILLRSEGVKKSSVQLMTVSAAVAVCRALKEICRLEAGIKWVNDIICNGRKICGILCEAVSDPQTAQIGCYIVGIGVNTSNVSFPQEIKEVAGSIECSRQDKDRLAVSILRELLSLLDASAGTIEEYKSLQVILGRQIEFELDGQRQIGRAVDIDGSGGLVVQCESKTVTLNSGQISLGSKNIITS